LITDSPNLQFTSIKLNNYMILNNVLLKFATLALSLIAGVASAQWPYDVPYVPSPQVVVDEMLRVANVTKDDFVMDLGSGDGRILITAARKFGARGIGVDLDENLIFASEENARAANVAERVQFPAGSVQDRFFQSERDYHVSAAGREHAPAARAAGVETRHAHRRARL